MKGVFFWIYCFINRACSSAASIAPLGVCGDSVEIITSFSNLLLSGLIILCCLQWLSRPLLELWVGECVSSITLEWVLELPPPERSSAIRCLCFLSFRTFGDSSIFYGTKLSWMLYILRKSAASCIGVSLGRRSRSYGRRLTLITSSSGSLRLPIP